MKLSHFFIDRPIFAAVLSIFITLIGGFAYFTLPVAQYPEIAPPTIVVTASYPGASAQVVSETVATPLEQQINGVENMLYMVSQATGDGNLQLTVTFALGTNLDIDQVLVQNRVAIATPLLPEEVQRLGVTVKKNSPDLLMVIHLSSPDGSRDQLYMSNYATLQIKDVLARLTGVGDVTYSARATTRCASGSIPTRSRRAGSPRATWSPPSRRRTCRSPRACSTSRRCPSRAPSSSMCRRSAVSWTRGSSRISWSRPTRAAASPACATSAASSSAPRTTAPTATSTVAWPCRSSSTSFPAPTRSPPRRASEPPWRSSPSPFPSGMRYDIVYDPTQFIAQSVDEVIKTIYIAVALVTVVVILFLQTWRASIVPIVAIPVSLIGTFAVLAAFGYSLNNLSLFGLVLAIGIVVDDAIVVVENVERNIRDGMAPRDAAHETMDEVGGALVAIALVLSAVFVPAAFIPGISGQFFRQFAVTIASATVISCFVSLTLSPALCALLFKPHAAAAKPPTPLARPLVLLFKGFNFVFDRLALGYGGLTRRLVRLALITLVVYAGLLALTTWQFARAPTGFIPQLDQGYVITVIQLPPGASLARTDAVVRRAAKILLATPGVTHAIEFAGFDGATFTNASNVGAIFTDLTPFPERVAKGLSAARITADLRTRLAAIQDAFIIVIPPPPVRGIGTAGGFKMMVQDKRGRGIAALEAATQDMVAAANRTPGLAGVFSLYNTRTPTVYADVDRVKAEMLDVPADKVFETLEVYLGSVFRERFQLSRADLRGPRPGRRAVPARHPRYRQP